ncbi:MAG: DUF1292 domain-containing protein [Clostridium sp.]
MDKNLNTIELFDEEGNAVTFNVVEFLDIKNPDTKETNEYVIVYEEGFDEDDVIALKVDIDEDGEDLLIPIDDEEELAIVQEAYDSVIVD